MLYLLYREWRVNNSGENFCGEIIIILLCRQLWWFTWATRDQIRRQRGDNNRRIAFRNADSEWANNFRQGTNGGRDYQHDFHCGFRMRKVHPASFLRYAANQPRSDRAACRARKVKH